MPEMAQPRRNVFVSHAHADNELCDRYVAALRKRGLDVWYDRTNLQAGHSLSADIEAELRRRTAFVVVATPASLASQWVRSEIAAFRHLAAQDPTRLFLPVRVAECEMPLLWIDILWIDAVSMGFEAAVDTMAVALGVQGVGDVTTPAPTTQPVKLAPYDPSPPETSLPDHLIDPDDQPDRQPTLTTGDVRDLLERARRREAGAKIELEHAIPLFERATELYPRHADVWSELGEAYLLAGREDAALAALNSALALDDRRRDWQLKGTALYLLQRDEEALAAYERYLDFYPNNRGTWDMKAHLLQRLGRTREAEEAEQRANKLGATSVTPAATSQTPEPVPAAISPTAQIEASVDELLKEGYGRLSAREHSEAIELFKHATELDPRRAYAWYRLGEAYYHSGRYEDALAVLDRALALDDMQGPTWWLKSNVLHALGRSRDEEDAIRQAFDAMANKP